LDGLTAREAFAKFKACCRGEDQLRLSCHPNGTLSVQDVSSMLNDWSREDWRPDVVCIDYADILAPPAGIKDSLEQTDMNWKLMRRLAQEHHCLVLTATQANADAYKTDRALRRSNFSGRKTKLAHVGGMLGLNKGELRGLAEGGDQDALSALLRAAQDETGAIGGGGRQRAISRTEPLSMQAARQNLEYEFPAAVARAEAG
jgi:hypothetical protein